MMLSIDASPDKEYEMKDAKMNRVSNAMVSNDFAKRTLAVRA